LCGHSSMDRAAGFAETLSPTAYALLCRSAGKEMVRMYLRFVTDEIA
jgi:hypothetical protein